MRGPRVGAINHPTTTSRECCRASLTISRGVLGIILLASPIFALLSGCQTLGPAAISAGRGAYNDVIARTNSEQTLSVLVRMRYADPNAILTVTSVTANLKFGATAGAQFGVGPNSNYSGNLVPLSAGVSYEDNPTITYAPVDGQAFLQEWLTPVRLETIVLVMDAGIDDDLLVELLVKRLNGLHGDRFASEQEQRDLHRALVLMVTLQRAGVARWIATPMPPTPVGAPAVPPGFEFMMTRIGDSHLDDQKELLTLLGLPGVLEESKDGVVRLPLILGVRTPAFKGIAIETRSVAAIMEIAAETIDVPQKHIDSGIVRPSRSPGAGNDKLLKIHSSPEMPQHASLAIQHRDQWYWIDDGDFVSKSFFKDIQLLFQSRLAEATKGTQTAPVLTIPVGG